MQAKVSAYQASMPALALLQMPGTRPRHWEALEARLGQPCNPAAVQLTLRRLVELQLFNHTHFIEELAVKAREQLELDQLLQVGARGWGSCTSSSPRIKGTMFVLVILDTVDMTCGTGTQVHLPPFAE